MMRPAASGCAPAASQLTSSSFEPAGRPASDRSSRPALSAAGQRFGPTKELVLLVCQTFLLSALSSPPVGSSAERKWATGERRASALSKVEELAQSWRRIFRRQPLARSRGQRVSSPSERAGTKSVRRQLAGADAESICQSCPSAAHCNQQMATAMAYVPARAQFRK